MNKTGMKETTDYTAHKWEIAEGDGNSDFEAKFHPKEGCFILYREFLQRDLAQFDAIFGNKMYTYYLPPNIFRKVINEVIGFVGFKNNVLIPKIEF